MADTKSAGAKADPQATGRSAAQAVAGLRQEAQRIQMEQQLREREHALELQGVVLKHQLDKAKGELSAKAKLLSMRDKAQQAVQDHAMELRSAQQQPAEAPSFDMPFTQVNAANPQAGVDAAPFQNMQGPEVTQTPGGPQPGPPSAQTPTPQAGLAQAQGGGGLAPWLLSMSAGQRTAPVRVDDALTMPMTSSSSEVSAKPNVLTAAQAATLALQQQHNAQQEAATRGVAGTALLRAMVQAQHQRVMEGQGQQRLGLEQTRLAATQADLASKQAVRDAKDLDRRLSPQADILSALPPDQWDGKIAAMGVAPTEAARLRWLAEGKLAAKTAGINAKLANENMKQAAEVQASLQARRGPIEQVLNLDVEQVAGAANWAKAQALSARSTVGGKLSPEDEQWLARYTDSWNKIKFHHASLIMNTFPHQRAIGVESKLLKPALPDEWSPAIKLQAALASQKLAFNYMVARQSIWTGDPSRTVKSIDTIMPSETAQVVTSDFTNLVRGGQSPEAAAKVLEQKYGFLTGTGLNTIQHMRAELKAGSADVEQ